MPEAAMTSGQPENDSVRPSISLEDAVNIELHDPDDDPETVAADREQNSEIETDEATDGQETDEIEASEDGDDAEEGEEAGEEDETSTPEPPDDAFVTVNGERKTLAELKKGYFREADYTRQKQQVSAKEKSLEAMSARVNQSVEAIADFLVKQIPPAPDPALLHTNRDAYFYQKEIHEASALRVQTLLEQAGEVKAVADALTAEQRRDLLNEENARLAEAFPATATDEGRKKFFETAATAAKDLGYSEDEIRQVMDHRMFALAHYAAIGMRAEKSRETAKAKVQNAPPVAPQKARPQGDQSKVRRNQEALKRLARTGSIDDAMAIDFE
jgi:hypothetical protein